VTPRRDILPLSVVLCLFGAAATAHAEDAAPSNVADALAGDGVTVQTVCTNCNNADLSLGGLGNDFVPITCDELPVTTGLAQIYLLAVMPATMIDKVAVERGACDAAREAAAVGGGITIERSTPKPGVQVNASADAGAFGWAGARADLAGKKDWFGGTFAATYGTSDAIDSNDDTNPDLPSFDRRTFEGHAEFEPAEHHVLRVGAADYLEHQKDGPSAFDFLSYLDPSNTSGEIKYNKENVDLARRQYDVVYEGSTADGSKLVVAGLYAKRSEDIFENLRWFNPVNIPTYKIDEKDTAGTFAWSRPVGTAWRLRAGASWMSRDYAVIDLLFNLFGQRPLDFTLTERSTELGAWGSFEYAPSSAIGLTIGARYAAFDYDDNETRPFMLALDLPHGNRVLPRAALNWKPAEDWTVRFTAGAGFRQAQPTYDEVCCGRRYRNNRGIEMETSIAAGIEGIYQPGPALRLRAAASVTSFDNYVLKMITSSFFYRPTYQNANVPQARFSTLELDAAWTIARWIGMTGSISWLDAENRTAGDAVPVLIDTGGSGLLAYTFHFDTIPYVAKRNAALSLTVRPIRSGMVSVRAAYTGPMLIQQMQASGASVIGGTLTDLYETPSFATLSIRYDQTLPKGIALYAGVDNALDFIETTLGKPRYNYNWGPLRGRYVYGGMSYSY
jgi:outer membrane receptor protein involved in Fe transport